MHNFFSYFFIARDGVWESVDEMPKPITWLLLCTVRTNTHTHTRMQTFWNSVRFNHSVAAAAEDVAASSSWPSLLNDMQMHFFLIIKNKSNRSAFSLSDGFFSSPLFPVQYSPCFSSNIVISNGYCTLSSFIYKIHPILITIRILRVAVLDLFFNVVYILARSSILN